MQAFSVENLDKDEVRRLREALKAFTKPSPIEGLFWIPIPEEVLAPIQRGHVSCQPHYFAVELGEDFISFDFLVRNFQRIRCDCITLANNQQKLFLLNLAKKIFEAAGVKMRKN